MTFLTYLIGEPSDMDEMDVKYKSGFYRQIEAFVNMVKTGLLKWPGKDLEDAYKTMLLAERFVNA